MGIFRNVRLLSDLLWVLQVTIGPRTRRLPRTKAAVADPVIGHRELAELMRQLPRRYAQRLPARTLDRVRAAAAAGRWENAAEILVVALRNRTELITPQERDELHALLSALNMPRTFLHGRKTPRRLLFPRNTGS